MTPETQATQLRPSSWGPLRIPIFRSLWIAALVSNTGTWMHDVAAGWMMTGIAPSPLFVSLLQTASSLPMFLLALPAGALADMLDRRRLLLVTFSGLVVVVAALGGLTLMGMASAWVLLAMTFLISIGTGLARPALDALTPEVVGSADMPQAVSLDAAGLNVGRAAGGTLAGIMIATMGSGAVFLANAASEIPYLVTLGRWKRSTPASSLPPESLGGAVKAGLRYVRHAPALRIVLLRTTAVIFAGCALWSLFPLIARGEMKLGSVPYGLLVGFFGAGALLGAVALPQVRARLTPNRLLAGATLLLAGVLVSLAVVRNYALVAVVMGVAGVAWLAMLSSLNTALQSSIPSWVRARGSALSGLALMGGMTAGSTVWGVLATARNVRFALLGAGVWALATLILGLRYKLPGKAMNLAPSLHWPAPLLHGSQVAGDYPVEVVIEYRIEPGRSGEFKLVMLELEIVRRRDGATEWSLEEDPGEPGRYIEVFGLESWTEHLRQHERVTQEDRALEDRVRSFHVRQGVPRVTHRIKAIRSRGGD